MAFEQVLKTLIQPKLKMAELFLLDDSAASDDPAIVKQALRKPSIEQRAGTKEPLVKIGAQVITNIESLIIDETGFITTLTMIFTDISGEFGGSVYPKRDLVGNIYIKSANDSLKPVRFDFLITSIKSTAPRNTGKEARLSTNITYIVKGEIFIPRLYNNISKSYPSSTSFQTLQQVSEELGLGFVCNDYTPADSMTWINFNMSPFNFIKHVTDHTYQDDNSFFTSFISKEGMLCLIDVNRQLQKIGTDLTFDSLPDNLMLDISQTSKDNGVKAAIQEDTVPNVLTNFSVFKNRSNYIYEANLISDHGSILKSSGYKKKIYYYDHVEADENNKDKDFFVAPTNTSGVSEKVILQPENEGLDEIGSKKWMGINYGNTHEHWQAARIYNSHNLKEIEKIQLRISLKGINFQVIRGMAIPLIITSRLGDQIRKEFDLLVDGAPNPQNQDILAEVPDTQLTGNYYVKGARYTYDPTDPHIFITELFLSRREWQPSKNKPENA
ncbi:hypothetical protein UFOVP699_266 [uncultured Caudovirales phage]|uniref:Uncharacterized protein n=1 Tax=uncultured Caudovirales phage TaxID=2100421 RepID=A0A6J5NIA1_9CAUD|nr:hypothetical protein UFOVP699_266 [uncultured Caudovirales phage]